MDENKVVENWSDKAVKGYELQQLLGAGGFGAVYRAHQPLVKRDVAIKVILPVYANQPDFIRRFEVEAELVARLEHPHIVPLYDYWRDPDGAFLVLRFIRGGSLRDSLQEGGAWEMTRVADLLDQVAGALTVAHRNNVIHRDIKPDNILLDEDGNAYLSDFGIAKNVGTRLGAEESGMEGIVGSPAYMAPEQILEQRVSPQTDIYGLGMLIYELLIGEHPFATGDLFSIISKHLNDPLPFLYEYVTHLPDALDTVLQKATAKTPQDRYPDVRSFAVAFREAMGLATATTEEIALDAIQITVKNAFPKLSITEGILTGEIRNPYKGLRPFTEADADDFFGRRRFVDLLLERLRTGEQFLAVVGPSGSGKSSVVKAGLLPALRRDELAGAGGWFIAEMTPGSTPIQNLHNALLCLAADQCPYLMPTLRDHKDGLLKGMDQVFLNPNDQALLVIDQFEELFTLVTDEAERGHFLDLIRVAVNAPTNRLRIVITLRADFTDRPLKYGGFGELMRQHTEFVLPLTGEELEEAIHAPVAKLGMIVEPSLIAAIVADVEQEPGALPLLQYALTELFERRDGIALTLKAYQESGGVLGALARRAEEVYQNLPEGEQEITRQVFLRLVSLGEGTEDTRRRAYQSELMAIDEARVGTVIQAFGKYRLLTFDRDAQTREPTISVAHEALIREWRRLQNWLDEGRADIRLQRILATAAAEWENAKRDRSFLLRGARLGQYEEWHGTTDIILTPREQTYLEASLRQAELDAEEEQERQARELALQKQAANRLRYLAVVLSMAALLAFGLVIFALQERDRAEDEAAEAARQQVIAYEQRDIAATAQADADLARVEAERERDIAATARADADLARVEAEDERDTAADAEARALAQSEIAAQQAENARITSLIANAQLLRTSDHLLALRLAYEANQSGTTSVLADNILAEIAYEAGATVRFNTGNGARAVADLSADGQTLLFAEDGYLQRWDTEKRVRRGRFAVPNETMYDLVATDDGQRAWTLSDAGTVQYWDVQAETLVWEWPRDASDVVLLMAMTPDQSRLVVLTASDTLYVLSSNTGQVLFTLGLVYESRGVQYPISLALDPQRNQAYVGYVSDGRSSQATILVWNLASGAIDATLETNFPPDIRGSGNLEVTTLTAVARLGMGDTVETLLFAGIRAQANLLQVFTLDERNPRAESVPVGRAPITAIEINPDRTIIAVGTMGGEVLLLNYPSLLIQERLTRHNGPITDMIFSPDGQSLVVSTAAGDILAWNLSSGAVTDSWGGFDKRFEVSATAATVDLNDNQVTFLTNTSIIERQLSDEENGDAWRQRTVDDDALILAYQEPYAIVQAGGLRVVNLQTNDTIHTYSIDGEIGVARFARFSEDGRLAAVIVDEATSAVWVIDLLTGEIVQTISGDSFLYDVVISPDNRYLATIGLDALHLYTLEADRSGAPQEAILTWEGPAFTAMTFTPDGRWFIFAQSDFTVVVWDFESQQVKYELLGYTEPLTQLVVDAAQSILIGAATEGGVYVWSLDDGALWRVFNEYPIMPVGIGVNAAINRIYIAYADGVVMALRYERGAELLRWVDANRYLRPLTRQERTLYNLTTGRRAILP